MTAVEVLGVFNYGLVFIYGLLLSVDIAGGCRTQRERSIVHVLCPVFLFVQAVFWALLGVDRVERIYPLIAHIPLVLALIFLLKKPVGVAIVATCTGYLCCQIPRWVDVTVSAVTGSALAGEISYTLAIVPAYILLRRYFVRAANDAMTLSPSALLLFGGLPVAYYGFDYATTIYSDALYSGYAALNEFLPTVLIVFYVTFLTLYHFQMQRRAQAEMLGAALSSQLRQSQLEMDALRRSETQTAVYQHDMRHHLNMIEGLLSAGKSEQAEAYIRSVQADIETITPKRFCDNDTVNLLCSAFSERAARTGVKLTVEAKLPPELPVSDTELCSIISNALENALRAVIELPETQRWVKLYCGVRVGKLLIEICNPCRGPVAIKDGLPVSSRGEGHGYGCRSIATIAERRGGLCDFSASGGEFRVQVMLPVQGGTE